MLSLRATGIAVAVVVAVGMSSGARATLITTFELDNVTFADGGTATGTLVLGATNNTYLWDNLSVDIITTAGTQFAGAHYASGGFSGFISGTSLYGQTVYNISATLFQFDALPQSVLVLQALGYPAPLSTTTPSQLVATTAYPGEAFYPSGPSSGTWRVLTSGSLNPIETIDAGPPLLPPLLPPADVPEPSTFALFVFGLLGVAGMCRRKSKV